VKWPLEWSQNFARHRENRRLSPVVFWGIAHIPPNFLKIESLGDICAMPKKTMGDSLPFSL